MAYKPKFPNQSYKPKLKLAELLNIARKIGTVEGEKPTTIDPVEFEWHPKRDLVLLHFQFKWSITNGISEQDTYTLAYPLEPFEIGYNKWIEKIRGKNE